MIRHTIYFVRHGQTVWNTEHRVQGTLDTPLTALGIDQARKNAADWAGRQTPEKWTHRPPGGETYQELSERVKAWLGDLPGDAVVVAHGCLGRVLRGHNLGHTHEEIAFAGDPEHDRVYRLVNGAETVW